MTGFRKLSVILCTTDGLLLQVRKKGRVRHVGESDHDRKIAIDERLCDDCRGDQCRTSLQVADICERFGVSEVTAKNDLDKLEKNGKLRRTHGGAVSLTRTITVSFPDQRLNLNVEAKRAITERAASFVHDGDSLFVDTGTTAFEFVHFLL